MNYDDYITGLHDRNSPMNETEMPKEEIEETTLTGAFKSGYELSFTLAIEEHKRELISVYDELKDYADVSENGVARMAANRLKKIISKI